MGGGLASASGRQRGCRALGAGSRAGPVVRARERGGSGHAPAARPGAGCCRPGARRSTAARTTCSRTASGSTMPLRWGRAGRLRRVWWKAPAATWSRTAWNAAVRAGAWTAPKPCCACAPCDAAATGMPISISIGSGSGCAIIHHCLSITEWRHECVAQKSRTHITFTPNVT